MSRILLAEQHGPRQLDRAAESTPDARVVFDDVSIEYASPGQPPVLAVERANLSVGASEFVSIVGPSGCGKSTLLKSAIGLLAPSGGQIRLDGQPLTGIPRQVGMMFQSDTLLPWATARQNVTLALQLAGVSKDRRRARAEELLRLVGLQDFMDRHPAALSGGMRKRVQLARLLAFDADILLMDEPFGALDAQTKIVLGRQFLKIWQSLRKSVLFVTHDLEEAIALSDRVVVMSRRPGRIKALHVIDLPRPRDFYEIRLGEDFHRLHRAVWADLAAEVDDATWH